jgi:ionotropic glutamate receptor
LYSPVYICQSIDKSTGRYPSSQREGVENGTENGTLVLAALIPISSEQQGQNEKDTFLQAVKDVNANDSILVGRSVTPVVYDTTGDPWIGFQSAVEGISREAVAVVGPVLSPVAEFLSPLAAYTKVPFVTPSGALVLPSVHDYVFQLAPSGRILSEAAVDLLVKFNWQHVGIVNSRFARSVWNVDMLASRKEIKIIHTVDVPFTVLYEDSPATTAEMVGLMMPLKHNKAQIIVVNVPDRRLSVVFRAAKNLSMIGPDYVWIVSGIESPADGFDPDLLDLMEGSLGLSTALADEGQTLHNITSTLSAYTYDCVWLLARAIDNFLRDGHSVETDVVPERQEVLPSLRRLLHGDVLMEYIRSTSFEGVTGKIQFNNQTGKTLKSLKVINVVNRTFEVVGWWKSNGDGIDKRVNMGDDYPDVRWPDGTTNRPSDRILSLNQTIKVLVMVSEPYVFYDPQKKGNDKFTGYLVDVLEKVKQGVGFQYQLEKWNGTYNDLVKSVGDVSNPYTIAIADTIPTADRWKVVDFTASFHESSITVLAKLERATSGTWTGFLVPLTRNLWIVLAICFFVIGPAVLAISELLHSGKKIHNTRLPEVDVDRCFTLVFMVCQYLHVLTLFYGSCL